MASHAGVIRQPTEHCPRQQWRAFCWLHGGVTKITGRSEQDQRWKLNVGRWLIHARTGPMKYLLLTTTVLGFASSLLIANGRTDLQSAAQARSTQQVGVALTSPASEDLAGLKLGVGVLLAAGFLTQIKKVAEQSSSKVATVGAGA